MKRIIIGISGASGAIYGLRLLDMLRPLEDIETHLVVSKAGWLTINYELGLSKDEVCARADSVYRDNEIWATIASGSFETEGMIIAPCSTKTLGAIASGYCETLLARAADVCLKERHRLVLMVREAPLHLGHLRNMAKVTEYGGIIHPPVGTFYTGAKTIEDMVNESCARVLAGFNIKIRDYLFEWKGF
ncbi:MAG TPA: UbiX family flavin prenyltransferase [Hellea balneolensis]|uniref:Flavin prenyltransferase UbiX n=1 Tax=Hellea balneolensis TaxID=287478 RepID=A0A7V5NXK5_9PROT|nr:UbiX family flavin prenyltransferase [Hellea balneolensis]